MRALRQLGLVALVLGLLAPGVAEAQYFAKINDIVVNPDGSPEVLVTVLDRYGEPPQLSAYESIKVYFGQANEFSLEGEQVQTYADTGKGTDFVIILPAYEGFGLNNSIAAAEGAGAFQLANVGESDTCMIFVYGDGVQPFEGNAAELAAGFTEEGAIARVARPYMLSAIDEAVRYYDELPPGRRRAMVLVGTGMDVRLSDATRVDISDTGTEGDIDRARRQVLEDHQEILRRYIEAVENVNARIYAIGYNDHRADYLEVLRALARKTGGTFRRVTNIGDLATTGGASGVFTWVGEELRNELVLRPGFEVEAGRQYEVWAAFRFPERTQVLEDVETRIFYLTVEEFETRMNIIPYLIVIGAILIVLFLLLVVLLVVLKRQRAARGAQKEKKDLEAKVAAGVLYCRTCYRKKMPEWKQCMFCQAGMAPLEEKPQPLVEAEEAQAKLDELSGGPKVPAEALVAGSAAAVAFYASYHGKPTCTTCGRVVDPAWPECMFCQSGMPPLSDVPPPEQAVSVGDLARPVAGGGLPPKKSE